MSTKPDQPRPGSPGEKYPHTVVANCTRVQAELLIRYDHHRVRVGDRWGIMITYPWMTLESIAEPLTVRVLLNPAPRHARSEDEVRSIIFKHPLAPNEVQAVIDALDFRPGPEQE